MNFLLNDSAMITLESSKICVSLVTTVATEYYYYFLLIK